VTDEFEEALDRGIREFNAGNFDDAHEIWEECWAGEVGERRRVLQLLIRIAVAFHKAEIGVPGGARRLLASARRDLDALPARAFGLDLASLRAELDGGASGDVPRPPRLGRVTP
jgi:predicted metal-dependent hydrolase